jgi:predicted amidohydrolase
MRDFWRERIQRVEPDHPDLIVLPEYCDLYHDQPSCEQIEYSRQAGNEMLDFFGQTARENRCHIVYPTLTHDSDGSCRNSTRVLDPSGRVIGSYHKNHVTIGEMEELNVRCGSEAPIIECDFGCVACVTCFDLNFDELRLKYQAAQPDVILFSSLYHGGLVQAYWAYACRAHFVSAIGFAGAPSGIISPLGQTLASTTIYHDFAIATINLDCRLAHLDYNFEKLKNLKAKYGTQVTITDPDLLGSVLISSQSKEKSVLEMTREGGIELLDEYFVRARTYQCQSGDKE